MVIELYTEEIIKQLRTISHDEVQQIADPDARYRAEAGSEKMTEINKCVLEAIRLLASRCSRFMNNSYYGLTNNVDGELPESFVFDFILSERRALGKEQGLMSQMNSFVVEYSLSKLYSMFSQGELSNKHSLLALDAGSGLDQLLYTKQPPTA